MFRGILECSILKIAREKGLLDARITDIRNFSYERHRKVDDRPYGGGPGMLLKPEPIWRAVDAIWPAPESCKIVLLSPQGEVLSQKLVENLSKERHLVLICGHYEGIDERVRIGLKVHEISVGDYILSGGEIPAMIILDAVVRLIPGVLGKAESLAEESFGTGYLEYPQYTRPFMFRGMKVPEILASGNHRKIQEWQEAMALKRTQEQRPDLAIRPKGENQ
jgi:tRNA (guanine37-N1)-methyltransferase